MRFSIFILLSLLLVVMDTTSGDDVLGDITFERSSPEGGEDDSAAVFPPSVFSHWIHRINYRCDACHDSVFQMEKGATVITMELINNGELCGVCHNDKIAFGAGFENCARCHRSTTD